MQKTMSETQLLQASLAGNADAFGTIVERYQSLICGITYSATGDFAKSQELAQETFIKAWKGLSQLKDFGKFCPWLCTIARNLVRKSIRQEQRDVVSSAKPLENMADIESPEPGPVEAAISREQQSVVWEALRHIPEQFREPIVLFYRRQQSVSQVAADLELSEEAVKQRLSRGRKLLRSEVAALVEDVLGRTGPGKTFTVAVIAALPALAPQTAAAAVAAAAAKGSPAAKAAFSTALSGAILGPLLGLLGGLFGSWMSIKNTSSSRERTFMIRMTIVVWSLLVLLVGLPLVLRLVNVGPKWMYWVLFAVFFALLLPLILWSNARQRQIQKEEGTYLEPQYHPAEMSKANVYGAFGGSVFGSVCWIIPMSLMTRDWLAAVAVVAAAGLIFIISTKKALHKQERYWRILIWDMIALCVLNLAAVNARWSQWIPVYRQSSSYDRRVDMPLWGVNLIFVAVFGGLLLMCLLKDGRQRTIRDKEQQARPSC